MTSNFAVPYLPVGTLFGEPEIDAVRRCFANPANTLSCGAERDAFEAAFAAATGAPHAIAVTNCTVALELATYLLSLTDQDEVIATTQTYQATLTPLLTSPARVVFADCDPLTLNVSVESVARLITDRTRAVYIVHYGGVLADISGLEALCDPRGIRIVEDCAHSMGASQPGYAPGGNNRIACFSFQSYKNISTLGEGGLIAVSDAAEAGLLRRIISIEPDADFAPRSLPLGPHSAYRDKVFRHEKNAFTEDCTAIRHPGTNSTLSEPAAAVGIVQLTRLDDLLERRRQVAVALDKVVLGFDGVRPQLCPTGSSAHHLYTVILDPDLYSQERVIHTLVSQGIEVQQRYFPLHLLPEWRLRGSAYGDCPTAERLWFEQMVNLPIYPQLTADQVTVLEEALALALSTGRLSR